MARSATGAPSKTPSLKEGAEGHDQGKMHACMQTATTTSEVRVKFRTLHDHGAPCNQAGDQPVYELERSKFLTPLNFRHLSADSGRIRPDH
jgi:hypothetical protein